MTVSGGEPLQQADFVRALMEESKRRGIHTALDTSGNVRWEVLKRLLEVTDLVLYDVKHMDTEQHRRLTGVPNQRILANLQRVAQAKIPFVVRIPVVPAHNDDETNFHSMGRFLSGLDGDTVKVELLPYHRLAQSKYERLEQEYPLRDLQAPERESLEPLKDILVSYGLDVRIG
jgi:pyruvate formate lyase activating enzyme